MRVGSHYPLNAPTTTPLCPTNTTLPAPPPAPPPTPPRFIHLVKSREDVVRELRDRARGPGTCRSGDGVLEGGIHPHHHRCGEREERGKDEGARGGGGDRYVLENERRGGVRRETVNTSIAQFEEEQTRHCTADDSIGASAANRRPASPNE